MNVKMLFSFRDVPIYSHAENPSWTPSPHCGTCPTMVFTEGALAPSSSDSSESVSALAFSGFIRGDPEEIGDLTTKNGENYWDKTHETTNSGDVTNG